MNKTEHDQAVSDATGRRKVKERYLINAMRYTSDAFATRIAQKGDRSYASIHEIYGVLAEEMDEALAAVRTNDHMQLREELFDIAVGCLFGIACLDAETLDW